MLQKKHVDAVGAVIRRFNRNGKFKAFIFGSSLRRTRFGDIDIGVVGSATTREIGRIKEAFEDSDLPYLVDVVRFDETSDRFKKTVLKEKILWIPS